VLNIEEGHGAEFAGTLRLRHQGFLEAVRNKQRDGEDKRPER
jgi:hypothetical protein